MWLGWHFVFVRRQSLQDQAALALSSLLCVGSGGGEGEGEGEGVPYSLSDSLMMFAADMSDVGSGYVVVLRLQMRWLG